MNITVRDLLDAGVHFGHQVRRFNPASKEFVFDHRHGVSIIDLEKTFSQLEKATAFITDLVASGKDILFVGTKTQAEEITREAASSVNMPYCANRWLGGGLTNFATIKTSLKKYRKYLDMENSGELAKMSNKKESAAIRREMARMHRNFEGIVNMNDLPAAIFVIDSRHEKIAVAEAGRMNIPSIAIVDTNSDPRPVDMPIPGNDDSVRAIRVIVDAIVEAVQEGLTQRSNNTVQKGINLVAQEKIFEELEQPEVRLSAGVEEATSDETEKANA